jgi:SAM-dependent methyltransferase
MAAEFEYRLCPACESERTRDLLPAEEKVATTLDLVFDRGRAAEFADVDLAAFRAPCFAICEHCALIFVRTRPTPEAAGRYYARLFHVIETPLPFESLPIPERFLARKGRLARDLIATLASNGVLAGVESVLYVRCTAGEGPRILRDEHGVAEIYALEVLPSLVRHAREVLGVENVERLFTPEFENPFRRQRFDLIVCDEAFGHALDPARVATNLKALLSARGALVAFDEKDHSQILRSTKLFPYGMNFFHNQLYTRKSLRSFLAGHGFSVEALPHPVVGKASSLKNTKILFVARPDEGVRPALPSNEVDELARLFRRWWFAHKWKRRGRWLGSFVGPGGRIFAGGGEARR